MKGILTQLRADHRRFRELSDRIEEQTECCQGGEDIDLELIEGIVRDATGYSNHLHHPLEERLFALIRGSDSSLDRVLDQLEDEHCRFAVTADQLSAMLNGVLRDEPVRRDRLVAMCMDYIDLFRRHIELEEEVFTRAERALTDEQWRALDDASGAGEGAAAEGDAPDIPMNPGASSSI